MKNLLSKLISIVLAAIMLFSTATASATERNKGTVKYLSEVALIEASSDEEADKILAELKEEKNGAFEGKISLDLNAGGNKKIYLAYKTSTNVDDAITDLAVMNMKGDYNMGSYEQLLATTLDRYVSIAKDYRVMAAEFKANYDIDNINAVIAHRQMNYYYIEKNNEKIYMGDYFLGLANHSDEELAEIIFKGNLNIIANLRALFAMGVGTAEKTLKDRIIDAYAEAAENDEIYSSSEYEEAAKAIKYDLDEMIDSINNLPTEIAAVDSLELEEDDKELSRQTMEMSLNLSLSFLELLREIPMGDTNLGDYVMNATILDAKYLKPIVAAASEAERLLMKYNSFYSLLLYDVLEKDSKALDEELTALEEEYEPLSVFYSVQNDLADGTIGVTGDAGMYSSSTGKNFLGIYSSDMSGAAFGYTVLGVAGVASTIGGVAYLILKQSAAQQNYKNLTESLPRVTNALKDFQKQLERAKSFKQSPTYRSSAVYRKSVDAQVARLNPKVASYKAEVEKITNELASTTDHLTKGQVFWGSFLIVAGLVAMSFSIWQLVEIYNEYKREYTDIPDNMVDVISNETYGDRFINYKNVPSYYYKDGKLTSRENDLNAYDGLQWVSMYYTKNYEAGPCLTATPDLIATESQRSGYTSIHLFGHSSNYNLNSYCNRKDASEVYLAFKYSTNQKSADTDIPDVVASSFNAGSMAISGFIGLGLGLGIMGFIKRDKKKNESDEPEKSEA